MTSAGKWVLGLLLLVVGAVFVARTVSSDPGSQAEVKNLPSAANAGATKDADAAAAAAAAAAAKKAAATIAGDVACKKACIEVNEVSNDSITTAKLAPGSVTLSKLAFEVPNLNELENEITARKAAEAATKAAQAEAAAAGAKNDAAITAAASNGITAEAAARTAADENLAKQTAAADADLLGKLNKELADRGAADDVLQGKLNTEIADRAGAITSLKGELANPNQVGAPIIKINNNEIVGDAVTGDKLLDATITAADLANDSIVGGLGGDIKDDTVAAVDLANDAVVGHAAGETLTNVKLQSLRGERLSNTVTTVGAGDLAVGTITGERTPLVGSAVGNIALGTIGTENIADGQVTFLKLDGAMQTRLTDLRTDLDNEVTNRVADVDQEESDRKADVDAEESARIAAVTAEQVARVLDVDTEEAARIAAMNAEIATRSAADTLLTTNLNNEISARVAKDTLQDTALTTFQAALLAEDTSALPADRNPNDGDGSVRWNNLEGVPSGFADGVDDDGNGKVTTLKNDLKAADNAANDGDGLVHWTNIDGIDAGVLSRSALDLACTGCVDATDLGASAVVGRFLGGDEIELGSVAGEELSFAAQGANGDIALGTITGQVAATDPGVTVLKGNLALGTIGADNLADGSVTVAKLGLDTVARFTAVENRVTTLENNFTDLADPAKATPSVATQHLTGVTNLTAAGTAVASIPAGSEATLDIVVANITADDIFTVTPTLGLPAGVLVAKSDVVTAGKVTVTLYNATAGALPAAATTWHVRWIDVTP